MQRAILRVTGFAVGFYYRLSRHGGEVPGDGPVILVGNHPNGLVDPIVLAGTTERPVRFLGKAPLFDMPVIGLLMRGLQVLPVYRVQDDADTSQNEGTFEAVYEALRGGDLVCLFPEGVSHSDPTLRRLKTGAARMALGAQARHGSELGVRIVPVGLVYRAKRRFRSRVATWVGEPIEVRDLAELHAKEERAAVGQLTERVAAGLEAVTLSLDRWEDLPLLELAERIVPPDGPDQDSLARVKAFGEGLQELRRRDGARIDELSDRVSAFRERLRRLGLAPGTLDRAPGPRRVVTFVLRNSVLCLLGAPLGILGALFWALPYGLVPRVAARVPATRDIHATVQILVGALLFALWLALLAIAGGLLGGVRVALAVLLLAPVLGLFALYFHAWRRERVADARTFLLLARRRGLAAHLRRERDAIRAAIEGLRAELARAEGERPPDAS